MLLVLSPSESNLKRLFSGFSGFGFTGLFPRGLFGGIERNHELGQTNTCVVFIMYFRSVLM